jgi:hypothetical protein
MLLVQECAMPANVDGMVREGISAYRAGRKDEARALLLRATEIDQYNEQAWLWLSAVVESPEEQRTCLENVLTINPNNERAQQGIEMLSQKGAGARQATAQADKQAEDLLASASFSPQARRADAEEMPTSIEWGGEQPQPATASSSVSANYKVNEPSKEEYDDWVSGLGIGNTAADPFGGGAGAASSVNPFGETDALFGDDTALGGGDLFASGPFSQPEPPPPVSKPAARPASPPVTEPPEKVFAEVGDEGEAESPLARRMNAAASKPAEDALDLLDDLASSDDDLLTLDYDEDFDDSEMEKPGADELFGFIPKAIRPTRLPGSREAYPVPILLGLLAVILLNIGAVALFVMNLTR